jgi:PAS domain S-box-containing protein
LNSDSARMNQQDVYKERFSLLLLDADSDSADSQVASLLKAGFIIHPRTLNAMDRLEQLVQVTPPDIVLCNQDVFNASDVLGIFSRLQPQLPVILQCEKRSLQQLREALDMGAQDLIQRDDTDLLIAVFRREAGNLLRSRQTCKLQQRLTETQQQFNELIHNSQDAIACLGNGVHLMVNPAYLNLFGFMAEEELLQRPLRELASQRDHETLDRLLQKIADNDQSGELEISLFDQANRQFNALLSYHPARLGKHHCTQIRIRDLTQAEKMEQRVKLLSDHDFETGLINRRQFINQLEELVPELQQGQTGSLIYLSVNNMSTIRAKAGPTRANSLLAEIGTLLASVKGEDESNLFSRLGDHTFALFCRKQDKAVTANLAEYLSRRLRKKAYVTELPGKLRPEFNVGLAESSHRIQSAADLLELAFLASETARQQGPDSWLWYEDVIGDNHTGSDINRHEQIIAMIDDALHADRFKLFYQPVVSLRGDSRENYAVLVRMLNTDNQTFLPETFLEHAKSHGRMAAIDRWIIRQAIEELARQRVGKRKINLFIQLSADSLRDDDLLVWICDCLQMFDAKGPWLTFQITDKDVRTNAARTQELVTGLKRISCRLAITRFGAISKYESLLKHLPIDLVKLDPGFTRQLGNSQAHQQRLNGICAKAHEYGVKVIAGEVEETASLIHLWHAGIDYIQGYLLQEPVESFGYDFDLD